MAADRRPDNALVALLRNSDLPGPVAAAVSVTVALVWVVPFAGVALFLPWAPVRIIGLVVVAIALAGAGLVTALVAGVWLGLAGVALVAGGIALAGQPAPLPMVAVILAALGAGSIAGAAARHSWDRASRARQRRLDHLPDWARDELGDTAAGYDPATVRDDTALHPPAGSGACAGLLDAVCRPLPGADVPDPAHLRFLHAAPGAAAAIHGTRLAVLVVPAGDESVIPAPPPLPAGARVGLFVLDDASAVQDPRALIDAHPAWGPMTAVTPADPADLAAFLLGGAPADGDARHGIAADVHARIRAALLRG